MKWQYYLLLLAILPAWWGAEVAVAGEPAADRKAAPVTAPITVSRPLLLLEESSAAQQRGDGPALSPHVRRQGQVLFDVDIFLPRPAPDAARRATAASFRQRVVVLGLFPDQTYNVLVEKESRPNPDKFELIGRLEGRDLATVSLVVTPRSYLLTIEDPAAGRLYRVVGDSESGIGRVTEIDPTQLPPRLYSPPLIPPDN